VLDWLDALAFQAIHGWRFEHKELASPSFEFGKRRDRLIQGCISSCMVGRTGHFRGIMPVTLPSRRERRVAIIKALAHPSRLAIAEALQDGEQCVCDLRDLVDADLSTVSKHLTVMREAGLLEMEKRGLNVYYRLKCPCLMNFFECVDSLAAEQSGPLVSKKRSVKCNVGPPLGGKAK